MLRLIQAREELHQTQEEFSKVLLDQPFERIRTRIRFRGGPHEDWVLWLPRLGIWGHFGFPPSQKPYNNRYWNVFGAGRPGSSVRIICEINSPLEGIDRRIGGACATDDTGRRLILHRGTFRGGGLTKRAFIAHYQGTKPLVIDGDRHTIMARVLEIGFPSAATDLAVFVHEVGGMKGLL